MIESTYPTTWWLFLDDERFPADNHSLWFRIARNVDDAKWMVRNWGCPTMMCLDHDLGHMKLTGADFARWFSQQVIYEGLQVPEKFEVIVHSQNPVGKKVIEGYFRDIEIWKDGDF